MKQIIGKKYYVKETTPELARKIIKKFHYSKKCVSNSNVHLGVFRIDDHNLIGALQLGPSMNGYKTTSKFHTSEKCLELNRMAIDESEPRNTESQVLALMFKWLKKYTDIDFLISFSDGKEDNVGYIYQATNWIYVGYLISDSFWDLDGKILHSVTVWHQFKEKKDIVKENSLNVFLGVETIPKTTNEYLCEVFDNVSVITSKQHIYLYPIKKRIKFKLEKQKYPKMDTEIPILKRKIIKENGKILKQPKHKVYSNEPLKPCI